MAANPDPLIHADLTLRQALAHYTSTAWLLDWFGLSPEDDELDQTLYAYCERNRLDYWSLTADLIDPGDLPDDSDTEEAEAVPAGPVSRASTDGGWWRR